MRKEREAGEGVEEVRRGKRGSVKVENWRRRGGGGGSWKEGGWGWVGGREGSRGRLPRRSGGGVGKA